MSEPIKGGKKPLSSKPVVTNLDDVFGNLFSINSTLKKELDDQGLEARFIDLALYKKSGGHMRGWEPYKPKTAVKSANDFFLGANPDGFVQRGTCVLAVRPKEKGDLHRSYLAHKNAQYSNQQKEKAAALREAAARAGLDTKISEGYED